MEVIRYYGLTVLLVACSGEPSAKPLQSGDITTVVGTGEQATDPLTLDAAGAPLGVPSLAAHLDSPVDIAFDASNRLFVIDWNGHKIRRLDADGRLYPVVGTGLEGDACEGNATEAGCPALETELNHPTDITFAADGSLFIAAWHNSKIKMLSEGNTVTNCCGSGARDYRGDGGPCFGDDGAELVALDLPSSVAFDRDGNLFIADQANQVIRRLDTSGVMNTVAGSCPQGGFGCPQGVGYSGDGGPARDAKIYNGYGQAALPAGKLAFDAAGRLYFADTFNHVVRRIEPGADGIIGSGDPAEELVETVVGSGVAGHDGDGGPATLAKLYRPTDIALDADGVLYVADRSNYCVRRVDTDGTITTAAGQCGVPGRSGDGGPATAALLDEPFGVAVDGEGSLYIADTLNHRIRKVLR